MENLDLVKRVKNLRTKKGFSQEELAEKAGLSLRTIQRVENGESIPRGDTLKRLAVALQVSPDEIIDWQIQEDNNLLTVLHFSQLSTLVFPLLGIIIPMAIWILKKETIKDVDLVGRKVLNFQITWSILLFLLYAYLVVTMFFHFEPIFTPPINGFIFFMILVAGLYGYNVLMVIINIIRSRMGMTAFYKPAIGFLR